MALHILKLCVGCESVEHVERWVRGRVSAGGGAWDASFHRTRMVPKRREEVLAGGSLYWVIQGRVQARQAIRDIREVRRHDGVPACDLVLDPAVVPTLWVPRRPFQGWRYLTPEDAPRDADGLPAADDLPPAMLAELADLGLL